MDFDLTEDQKEIKNVAHELLAARSPWARVREAANSGAYDDRLWQELVELGWPGIAVAEEHTGQGLGLVELAVLAEEHGYACASTPLISAAAAAAAISACGSELARAELLPGLITGELRAGVGSPAMAADGAGADLVVLVDGEEATLVRSPHTSPFETIDPTRRYATVELDEDDGAGAREGLDAGAADRVRVVLAAEVLGLCQRALQMTLDYVKDRKQFGVPVGSFQAVSHRCAEMLLATESVRSVVLFAAWAADADPDRLPEAAALAAACAAEAGRDVAGSAIQAHGGIGFTWEADVHWLYKRAQCSSALLGGARGHRAKLARLAADRVAVAAG